MNQGYQISRRRVCRLMKSQGLFVKAKRKFKHTTDSNHDLPIAHNLWSTKRLIKPHDGVSEKGLTDHERSVSTVLFYLMGYQRYSFKKGAEVLVESLMQGRGDGKKEMFKHSLTSTSPHHMKRCLVMTRWVIKFF